MISLILLVVGIVALAVGTYTDFKTREVPDWVSYGVLFTGLGLRLLYSFITFDWWFLLWGLIGGGIYLAVAYLLYYTGQWGGGDSKLLIGLGVVFGTYPEILKPLNAQFFHFPLLAVLIINMLLCGAVYGIIWSVVLAIKKRSEFSKQYKLLLSQKPVKLARIISLAMGIILLFFLAFVPPDTRFMMLIFIMMLVLSVYLWLFIKSVENACMFKLVPPDKLTEGDWIAKEIKVKGKYITGPKDLGISKEKIELLKKFYAEKKVGKILVKEGIPFVPSIFAGVIITLVWGNMIFYLVY
jgi:Flp pilus assembly protein protease CpaA